VSANGSARVSLGFPEDPDPSNDAQRLQKSDGLESGCHAVRSPARIVRSASFPRPDRCPVTPPGSMADVSSAAAGGPVSTYRRLRLPDHRKRGTDKCFYHPSLAFSEHQIACPAKSRRRGRFL